MFKKILAFLKSGIWNIPLENLKGLRRTGVGFLKVLLFSFRKLRQDQLLLRAPALAFFSLLAVVPVAALVFGVAKGFGLQGVLQGPLQDQLAPPGNAKDIILQFAQSTLQTATGGWVAGLGLVMLFVSVILVLGSVEASFNKIWGIQKSRSLSVKVRDYFSMIFVGTLLLLVSLSLTVALSNIPSIFGRLNGAMAFLLSLAPYALVWLLFAFLIVFMPNRKVNVKAGLFAGIVSGTLYQVLLNSYLRLQVTVTDYNAIYGSLAALPLFLIWLQISWLCLLFGAEISYSFQNVETIGFERDPAKISPRAQKMILLDIMHYIVKSFMDPAKPPPSADRIAKELGISGQLIAHLLEELVEKGLVVETLDKKPNRTGFQPGVPPETLTLAKIVKAVEERGISDVPVKGNPSLSAIKEFLNASDRLLEKSPLNVGIEELR